MRFCGKQGPRTAVFPIYWKDEMPTPTTEIRTTETQTIETRTICVPSGVLVFVSSLKLDLANRTVIADAAALPLSDRLQLEPSVSKVLDRLQD